MWVAEEQSFLLDEGGAVGEKCAVQEIGHANKDRLARGEKVRV